MDKLKEYRVSWTQCPTINHSRRVLFVRAGSEEDAEMLAVDHIERTYRIERFVVHTIATTCTLPSGHVCGPR